MPAPDDADFSLSADYRIDSACLRFEAEWQQGRQPRLEDFLGQAEGGERRALFHELLRLELHYRAQMGEQLSEGGERRALFQLDHLLSDWSERWARGEYVPVDAYLKQHPDLTSDPVVLVELVFREALLRLEVGDKPALGEYIRRFPNHESSLRQLWAGHEVLVKQIDSGDSLSTTAGQGTKPIAPDRGAPGLPVLPGYEVLEEIGRGGMGRVYKARQIAFDRLVAVKVLLAHQLAGAEEILRFHIEAQAIGRLDHPHVVRVHAFGQEQACPYFAMEYLSGGSLAKLLRQGPMEVRRSVELIHQVALGVGAAHDQGVLHRDLKPANVLLDSQGNARVADFGLAKLLDSDSGHTATDAVMGTPYYMSPEQAAGKTREIGRPADVWALGVILYQCLTGTLPFKGESSRDTLRRIQTRDPERPRRLRPEVPEDLEAICLKCLCKEPKDRYESANALGKDLADWLAGRRPSAYARPGLQTWLVRHPRLLLVGLASLGAVLVALAMKGPAPRSSARDSEKRPKILIGEKGMPTWWRYRLGGKFAALATNKEGFCTLSSTPAVMVDLAPSTGRNRYRIRARVRHESTAYQGMVGVYFAGREHASPAGSIHRLIVVSFNDILDERAQMVKLANKAPGLFKLPKGNKVNVDLRHRGELPDGKDVRSHATLCARDLFQPSGSEARWAEWRSIQIIVSPPRIDILWEQDVSVGKIDLAGLDNKVRTALTNLKRAFRKQPAVQGLSAGFDLRGAVGLYLFRGSASFCQVRIEPLESEDGTE